MQCNREFALRSYLAPPGHPGRGMKIIDPQLCPHVRTMQVRKGYSADLTNLAALLIITDRDPDIKIESIYILMRTKRI